MSEQRYSVKSFSFGLVGVWDRETGDMVKNPTSGRRKLFRRPDHAQKLCDALNKAEQENL